MDAPDDVLPRRTLTVIFADMEQTLSDNTWNISVLSAAVQHAVQVADAKETGLQTGDSVLTFDGSPAGELPETWADTQHQAAVSALQTLLQSPHPLTLTCLGAGSGGISALRLAACLGQIPRAALEVNLHLLDPVVENQAVRLPDVSASGNLLRVLSLYAAAASDQRPVFPDYPAGCEVGEEVCPGSHTDIQCMDQETGQLTYLRSLLFLKKCGTPLSTCIPLGSRHFFADREIGDLENDLAERYQFFVRCGEGLEAENRRDGSARRRQVYISADLSGHYLNAHHRALAAGALGDETCILDIKKTPQWHFFLRQALLWLLVGVAVAAVCQMAGVLALVPILQSLSPVLGALTAVPVLSSLSFAVWQALVKPLARCFMPSPDSQIHLPDAIPQGTYRSHFSNRGLLREGVSEPDVVFIPAPHPAGMRSSVQNMPSRESTVQENRSSLRRG